MAKTAELILRLVDQVTAPAKAINSALRGVNAVAQQVGRAGRSFRRSATDMAGLSIPVLAIADDAARQVYEFEKVGNAMEAASRMTSEQRESIEDYVQLLNSEFPATNAEILGAANELSKAGMKYEEIVGSLRNTLNLALAGDYGIPESADVLVSVASAMRLPMDTLQGVQNSTEETADVIAYAAQSSLANIDDIALTSKYVAPLAAAAGMSIQEMGAAISVLAQNGIKGSNAGTGLRFALFSIISPSKAAQAALAKLNIDIGDYVKGAKQVNAADLTQGLGLDGIDISALNLDDQITAALNDPAIMKSPAKVAQRLTDLIGQALGETDPIDLQALNESLSANLAVLGTQVDFKGFMAALRDNPASESFFDDIFGKQHGAKMMALNAGDFEGTLRDMEMNYRGAAQRMAQTMTKGIVGDWGRLTAAVENLFITLSDAGILADATKGIIAIADGIEKIANFSPNILKLGTYSLLALAGVAPLAWAFSGLMSTIAFGLNPITLVIGGLATLAYLNWDQVNYFLAGFGRFFREGLSPETVALFTSITDAVNGLWKSAQGASKLSLIPLGIDFGKRAAELVNLVPRMIEQLKRFATEVTPVLQSFNPLFESFGRILNAAAEALTKIGAAGWDGIIKGISEFNAAQDPQAIAQLNEWAASLANFAAAKNDADAAAVAKAGNDISNNLPDVMGWMGKVMGDMPANTVREINGIGAAAQAAGAAMANIWTQYSNAYTWAVMDIRLNLRNFLDWITSALNSTSLWDAGVALIQSLWDGMQSKFGEMMAWVGNIGPSIAAAIGGAMGGTGPAATPGAPSAVINGQTDVGLPAVQARASGGSYGPGWLLTGEKGPELRRVGDSGHVVNASDTKDILSGKNRGGNTQHNWYITGSNAEEIAQKVSAIIDSKLQRSRGLSMDGRMEFE